MIASAADLESHFQSQLGQAVFGQEEVVHALTIAFIDRGHILLEAPPGAGKTRLSKAFAQVLGGSMQRVQGTADLMPADITGVHIFNTKDQSFEFQRGPIFADVVLVDEINRAGPKTQSALLEAMEERQVTVDRETFKLSENFVVVATQNPKEFEGTFPLPESQLDRFCLCVSVPYLSRESETRVLSELGTVNTPHHFTPPMDPIPPDTIDAVRLEVDKVGLAPELLKYILDITDATRTSSSLSMGLSTRGALTLARCARIEASLRGGEFVIPDDVKQVAAWVVAHRLQLTAEAAINGDNAAGVLNRLLDNIAVPR
ncbi:MAG: MoxR family ATPase [Pseudomonadota bacterium]